MQLTQLPCLHKRKKLLVGSLDAPGGGGTYGCPEGNQWDLLPVQKFLAEAFKFRAEGALCILPPIREESPSSLG